MVIDRDGTIRHRPSGHSAAAPWTGELLRLGVEVAQGTEVTRADLERLGSPAARLTVVGVDPGARATVDLTAAYTVRIQLAD